MMTTNHPDTMTMMNDGGKSISFGWPNNNIHNGPHNSFMKTADGKQSKTVIDGQRIGVLFAICAATIVFVKFLVLLTGKPFIMLLNDTGVDALMKLKISTIWISTNFGYILWPLICGLSVTVFTWAMVYFDSDVPGVNPPSPMSAQKYNRYGRTRYSPQQHRTCHLNYLMSIASGIVVFFLLYSSNCDQ